MASPAMGAPGGGPQQPQGQPGQDSGQQPNPAQGAIVEFRDLAMKIQQMAQKYPEFTESAAKILPEIQKGMVRVAGNQARTPDRQAPPVG